MPSNTIGPGASSASSRPNSAACAAALEDAFRRPLWLAERVMTQKKRDPYPKVYTLHAPEVECIGKGKAQKPYEFGVKVSVATTLNRCKGGQFADRVQALLRSIGASQQQIESVFWRNQVRFVGLGHDGDNRRRLEAYDRAHQRDPAFWGQFDQA